MRQKDRDRKTMRQKDNETERQRRDRKTMQRQKDIDQLLKIQKEVSKNEIKIKSPKIDISSNKKLFCFKYCYNMIN